MADVIFMKSDRDSHAVLRCLRRQGIHIRSWSSCRMKLSKIVVRGRTLPVKEKFHRNVREVVCKLLQILQSAHLHPAIFHSYLSYNPFATQRYSSSRSSAISSYYKAYISSFSIQVQKVNNLLFNKLSLLH